MNSPSTNKSSTNETSHFVQFAQAEPKTADDLNEAFKHCPQDRRSLAQILLDAGHLEPHAAPMLTDLPVSPLRQILIRQLGVAADDVQRALATTLGLPFVDPSVFEIEQTAVSAVRASLARQHCFMPLCNTDRGLIIAAEDPENSDVKAVLALNTQHAVEFVVATRECIEKAIAGWYGPEDDREAIDEFAQLYKSEAASFPLAFSAGDSGSENPVVRLVHNLLLDAIQQRASDVHIRPLEDSVDLLFRLDGVLVKMRSFPKSMLATVVSRIKIIGNMDIAEHRLPQDGRARIEHDGHDIDLRLSTIPTVQGESVVVRILNSQAGQFNLEELGFGEQDLTQLTEILSRTSGLVLVSGPTGSGKSTALYAAIKEICKRMVGVVTVEDPVENRLQGVNQVQANGANGLTFAKALKHILRHDPDVIMVGEIRDAETAKIAVESALTGHQVLSTLHTNDAASSITRLLEMGIEPYLIKTSLSAVLGIRLVRKNCVNCIEPEQTPSHVRDVLGLAENETSYRGTGCLKCHGTGYSGRRCVYELLPITPEVRNLIDLGVSSHEIEQLAVKDGMQPLTENALDLARSGETSFAEVYRVRTGN